MGAGVIALVTIGVVLLAAAIVGGTLKLAGGIEIPPVASLPRQVALGSVGVLAIVLGLITGKPASTEPGHAVPATIAPRSTSDQPAPETTTTRTRDTGPETTASSAPTQAVYTDKIFKFSPPPGCSGDYYRRIDLDAAELNGDDSDLRYYCLGAQHHGAIQRKGAKQFGEAPSGSVTAENCREAARTTDHDEVDVSTISANKTTWCVITHSGQIAWIRVIDKGEPFGASDYREPTLTLQVTLWPPL